MYGWRSAGGWNKRNGQIERTARIDSFDIPEYDGFLYSDNVTFDCYHETVYCGDSETETAELQYEKWRQQITLSRVRHGFGGSSVYWLCPRCGKRSRFLYFNKTRFECRGCVGLNYQSQQSTKNEDKYYRQGIEYAQRYLEPPPPGLDGFSFSNWIPGKPRGMHRTTYRRHLRRFLRYQRKYKEHQLEAMMKILGQATKFF